jgi:SulP family sulfate permease
VLPGSIVALVLAHAGGIVLHCRWKPLAAASAAFPASCPRWTWPAFSWESARFPAGAHLTLALLGAIESLLCARVADGMIDDRHDPNQELMAQGVANFVTPFFGGMPATGTIARTVTNIKSGAASAGRGHGACAGAAAGRAGGGAAGR